LRCGNRLHAILRERRLSLTDLATLTGLPYTTILRMARAGGNPLLEHALRVGAVLDASVEELFWVRKGRISAHVSERG
jgi:transcriptional regulator with XRE-family HTH domain